MEKTREDLFLEIQRKKSYLCIGLDSDWEKIPQHLKDDIETKDDPQFEFNKKIIDATHDLGIAYKLNLAFYEEIGSRGWLALEKTIWYIRNHCPKILIIADAKRGDIGNTAKKYANAIFNQLRADAITINPYMGEDSVQPFLEHKGKWSIVLGLTSNKGAEDIQQQMLQSNMRIRLFEHVIRKVKSWGTIDNTMFVVGATQADCFSYIRTIIPDHFLLVPGIGAQGGNLEAVTKHGINKQVGLIVNSSRGIIFASEGRGFAEAARAKAKEIQQKMAQLLVEHKIIT